MMFLAIDPGRAKCGWALVEPDGRIVDRGISARAEILSDLIRLTARHSVDLIVLGNRTGHRDLRAEIEQCPGWHGRICLVEENRSSEEARRRCVRETARGWRRLLPASLRYPQQPYDDYVAVILAERYLRFGEAAASPCRKDGRKHAP